MIKRIWQWFTTRWPYYQLKRILLDEEIAGGASYAYTLGSSILAVIALQVATGVTQLFYYVPSIDHAYDSVSYLRIEVPFGWLVHSMHYWGANVMVVLVALHMVRVYMWGAYKSQLTWLIGIGLLMTTMALTFTGAPLIWDMKGYWAAEVGSSITGTAPVLGPILKIILRGGETMGQLTLSRFFAIHIVILVPALLFLVAVHVASFRTTGVVGAWSSEKRKQTGLFWPDQVFKDTVVLTTVIFITLTLSVFSPPPFTGPADPSNSTYLPKPEWNFLFLYQALKYFKGPLETIGTAGVPTVLIGLLVLLPFIDRKPERNPALRPVAMISLAVYAGIIITLTVIGYLSPGYAVMPAPKTKSKVTKQTTEKEAQPLPDTSQHPAAGVDAAGMPGAKLFSSETCIDCHSVHGKGGSVGPELSSKTLKNRDRAWLIRQIRNPKSHNPESVMPSFDSLNDGQVNDLVDFLLALSGRAEKAPQPKNGGRKTLQKGDQKVPSAPVRSTKNVPPSEMPTQGKLPGRAAYTVGNTENGAVLFKEHCVSCHGHEGKGGVPNPGSEDGFVPHLAPIDSELFNTDPGAFAQNIDTYIQHGSVPEGPNPALKMLPFGDSNSLTQEEIANLEAYVLHLNRVDRAALLDPGMRPLHFYYLAVFIFSTVALILGGIRKRRNIS